MRYIDFRQQLDDFLVFSIKDIRKIEPSFDYRRIHEWRNKGYIKEVRRGYYIFSNLKLNEDSLYTIANQLYNPSYVSLETALRRYNLIPETVYAITSISTKKTAKFNQLIDFRYRSIKPSLFFGYILDGSSDHKYKIAEPEKALLDYLYLHPEMSSLESFYEWRFDLDEFSQIADLDKLRTYLTFFNSPTLTRRVKRLLKMKEINYAYT